MQTIGLFICSWYNILIMPELPEVETIRRGLERTIVGKDITEIKVRLAKLFYGDPHILLASSIESVRRFGKGLVIDLSNGYSLAAHVKMTGQFVYVGHDIAKNFHPKLPHPDNLPTKHTHVIFSLLSKEGHVSTLFYNDIRKFGWIKVLRTDSLWEDPFFKSLGPEPLSSLTRQQFVHILSSSTMPIKNLLMDQSKISGLGNIYANDSLYAAEIDPRRKSCTLDQEEGERLFNAILEVLNKGLLYGGASKTNYITVEGKKGQYQDHFLVYGKDGKPCMRCGTEICKIKQGGRSSFYCPTCQK